MSSIGGFLIFALQIYNLIVIARVLLSWFPNIDRSNPIVVLLYELTEPVLQPIRELLRRQFPNSGPMDFSPIVLWIIIIILMRVIGAIF